AEDLCRYAGDGRKRLVPRHAVGDGVAGDLPQVANIAAIEGGEHDAHTGLAQACRVLEGGAEIVEAGNVVHRVDDDGHTGARDLVGDHPSFLGAREDDAYVLLPRELQHAHDVCGAVDADD